MMHPRNREGDEMEILFRKNSQFGCNCSISDLFNFAVEFCFTISVLLGIVCRFIHNCEDDSGAEKDVKDTNCTGSDKILLSHGFFLSQVVVVVS